MDQQPPEADEPRDDAADAPEDGVLGEIAPEEEAEPAPPDEEPRRPRRRRSRTIGCMLALLGALAGAGLGVWFGRDALFNRQPAGNEGIVMPAPEPEGETAANRLVFSPTPERPNETPEIISAETELIWCFYDLASLPADAPLTATWSHEGEPLGDFALVEHEAEPGADHARGRFAIHPPPTTVPPATEAPANAAAAQPAAGFASGIYEVELTSPEYPDVVAEASFVALPRAAQILQGGGEPEGPPVIRSLQTATGVTEAGEPTGLSTTFPADVGRIMTVFGYAGIMPGSVVTVRWDFGDKEVTRARAEIAITSAEGRGEAWLETGGGDMLPAGEYRVSVHFGDEHEPLATTSFAITAPDAAPSPTP